MDLLLLFSSLIVSYIFGSISVSRLVSRKFAPGIDLDRVEMVDRGTGETYHLTNVGATTASVMLGPKIGAMIGVLDIVKGILPTLAVRLLFSDQPYYLAAGIGVVSGHIWTIFHRFRGGGGLSAALGAFLAVDPLGTLATNLFAMFLGFIVFKEFLVAMTAGTWLMIPWLWIRTGRWEFVVFAIVINLLMVIAIVPDIRRYIRARRMGTVSMEDAMQEIPMGRMMNRLMERMGLSKGKSKSRQA